MIKVTWKKELPVLVMLAAMVIITPAIYDKLPPNLPIHWNIKGEVDGYLPKTPLTAMLFPLIGLIMWGMFILLPHIDPKKEKYELFRREYDIIKIVIIGFFLFIYLIIISNSLGINIPVEKAVPVGVAVLVIIIGNFMGKIRHNYFVGFRLPWTLADEDVWNKTHRLGGRLMVAVGILSLAGLLLSPAVRMYLLMGSLFGAIGVTTIYSYVKYKGKYKEK